LLFKGTMELHGRLEGTHGTGAKSIAHGAFLQVIAQIVVLDAVFSLDSVIHRSRHGRRARRHDDRRDHRTGSDAGGESR